MLDATGIQIGSTEAIVAYYETIGFTQMFPDEYDTNIKNISVPMIARVRDILGHFKRDP